MQLTETGRDPKSKFTKAFCQFAGCKENEIAPSMINGHAIVFYNGISYKVSTYETLLNDFAAMFEARQYRRISSEIRQVVWIEVIQRVNHFSLADFIVSLYQEWNLYWKAKATEIEEEKVYNQLRNQSWEQLIILIETVKISRSLAPINAARLDPCFVPIVALAIWEQYEFTNHFCDDLIDVMTEAGLDHLSFGDTYQVVFMTGANGDEFEEPFYVYNPNENAVNGQQ